MYLAASHTLIPSASADPQGCELRDGLGSSVVSPCYAVTCGEVSYRLWFYLPFWLPFSYLIFLSLVFRRNFPGGGSSQSSDHPDGGSSSWQWWTPSGRKSSPHFVVESLQTEVESPRAEATRAKRSQPQLCPAYGFRQGRMSPGAA